MTTRYDYMKGTEVVRANGSGNFVRGSHWQEYDLEGPAAYLYIIPLARWTVDQLINTHGCKPADIPEIMGKLAMQKPPISDSIRKTYDLAVQSELTEIAEGEK